MRVVALNVLRVVMSACSFRVVLLRPDASEDQDQQQDDDEQREQSASDIHRRLLFLAARVFPRCLPNAMGA
jgi:hypothetical protein